MDPLAPGGSGTRSAAESGSLVFNRCPQLPTRAAALGATRSTPVSAERSHLSLLGPRLFDAVAERLWAPGEPRRNTLVFIGRNLDRAELVADFEACLAE